MAQNNTTKSYTHHTTSNRTTKNIKDDKPIMFEIFGAIANREGVPVSQIKISMNSISESLLGVLCLNGDLFSLSITVKYKVIPAQQ